VTEWMEGELDDDRRSELEEHLVICPDCAVFVRQLRLEKRALDRLRREGLPTELRERLLEAVAGWAGRRPE